MDNTKSRILYFYYLPFPLLLKATQQMFLLHFLGHVHQFTNAPPPLYVNVTEHAVELQQSKLIQPGIAKLLVLIVAFMFFGFFFVGPLFDHLL